MITREARKLISNPSSIALLLTVQAFPFPGTEPDFIWVLAGHNSSPAEPYSSANRSSVFTFSS
jgi:hypothetical protein